MMAPWPARLLLVIAVAVLAGCGFHLQQGGELPRQMDRVRLEMSNPYTDFARRLQILLEQNGVQVVEDESATAVLRIGRDQVRKEILTIGDNARVREYRLRHYVDFIVLGADGTILVPEQALQQNRVISFDETDILGAALEDEQLRKEMADTLARQVLRRIGTAGA